MANTGRRGGPRGQDEGDRERGDRERGDREREQHREHEREHGEHEREHDDPEEHHRIEKRRFDGGLPATPELYARAREQWYRLPGAVARPSMNPAVGSASSGEQSPGNAGPGGKGPEQ
jgi:hypothetical protein